MGGKLRRVGLSVLLLSGTALPATAQIQLDELFVTGTTTDITPLVQLDGRPVGPGTPGRITRLLAAALERRLYATAPATSPALAGAR